MKSTFLPKTVRIQMMHINSKLTILIVSILLLLTTAVSAQSDTVRWKWGLKLTWNHFLEDPTGKGYDWSLNSWKTVSNLGGKKGENPKIQITIYLNKASSYVQPEAKTTDNLERINHTFNLYELGARKARYKLDSITKSGGKYDAEKARIVIERAFDWYNFITEKLAQDYNGRGRVNFRPFWRNKVDSLFKVYRDYNKYALNIKSDFGGEFDLQLGTASWVPATPLYVKYPLNIHFSMIAGGVYKKNSAGMRLGANGNTATPVLIQKMGLNMPSEEAYITQGDLQLYLGRRIFQTTRFGMSFYVAGGGSYLQFATRPLFWTWSYTPSIAFDWDMFAPELKDNQHYHVNLRFKVDYTVANYFDYYQPRLLTFSIGFSGFGYSRNYGVAKTPERFRGWFD
ncbi:MAG: hypothetical protein JXQ87_10430 [Bacteroidia bacterium]